MPKINICVDIFSGNPNPTWELSEGKVKEFFEIRGWKELIYSDYHAQSLGLGYRVFYVTTASAANYYTFLGEIQEGQGTIAEDEADDIGYNKDKQRILKTGYASGGNVPKVELSKNGSTRNQVSYLTFCHKWLAMEELPDEKKIRGMLDRSFIFKFIMGDVKYNIKRILKDEKSNQHKQLVHLRKLLFAFKLLKQDAVFPDLQINIKNRNAELVEPLLRIFYKTSSFDKIQKALSTLK